MQRRIAEELIQDHVGRRVALQLDDDPHAVAVALVAEVRDALDPLFPHQFGDPFDQGGLVHLIGNLGDDDHLTFLADRLDARLAAHDDGAASADQRVSGARTAHDLAAGGKVRARYEVEQRFLGRRWIVDQRQAGVDHLTEIMRRNVGGHTDRNAARAVDQEIGDARRQDDGLQLLAVVVLLEVDGVLVDIGQEGAGRPRHPALRVAHGGRHIPIHRAEIALAVHQRQAHRERLSHPRQREIDRLIAMGMEAAQNVADHTRAL